MSDATSNRPLIARSGPYPVDVEAGKSYWWCACGRSDSQPFCDGSHKICAIVPLKHVAERTGTLWFCGCKRTGRPPLCDGSHNSIA
jgi:CDGSH-type Zn-finger protein